MSYEAKILLIDDDEKLSSMIKEYLESLGCSVETAETGKSGLQKVQNNTYVAVILDVMMPEKEFSRVFEPLYRVEKDRARKTGGSGLGLQ